MNEQLIRIILDILLIVVIILGILWKAVWKDKKTSCPVNLELIPGHSDECQRRGDEIIKTTEAIKRIDVNLLNIWTYVKKNGKL